MQDKCRRHTLAIMVDNEVGALIRVISLFTARCYNIESVTVSEVNKAEKLSRITIVTIGDDIIIKQIIEQLKRLIITHKVVDLTVDRELVERELVLVKVACINEKRVEALRLSAVFRARVVDITNESFVFEITGSSGKVDAFIKLMQPLGVIDISRTGVVAIARGKESM